MRQYFRTRRAKQFHARVEEILGELDPATRARDPHWPRTQIGEFDELKRPIAATMLIERLKPASEEERVHMLAVLREAGAVDSLARSTARGLPWRRALAIRTLGWIGAEETVPLLVERLSDRNRYVRESAVRALGRISDSLALPSLAELFRSPGRVGPGVVYDALVAFGPEAEPVFADALGSEIASASPCSPSRRMRVVCSSRCSATGLRRCGAPRRTPWDRSQASGSRTRSPTRRETSRRRFGALRPAHWAETNDVFTVLLGAVAAISLLVAGSA
jgi:hypothetical protein